MKPEYHEGPEAADKFEKMAKRIFRAPKSSAKPVPKKHAVRKPKKSSKRAISTARSLILQTAHPSSPLVLVSHPWVWRQTFRRDVS